MIEDLLIHRISLVRKEDNILTNKTLPFSQSINLTIAEQPVVLEFAIPAGTTGSFSVTGVNSNGAVLETVTLTSSNPRSVSVNSFTGITTVGSSGGSAGSVSVYLRSQSGQPIFQQNTVISNYPARFSRNRQGNLVIRREMLTTQDEHVLFLIYGPDKIRAKDKIIDDATGDSFMIVDVDDVSDSYTYHHTECTIALLDRTLE